MLISAIAGQEKRGCLKFGHRYVLHALSDIFVIYGSYVICDGCCRRFFSHPAEPPTTFSSTIKLLSFQFRKVFSGTLVAMYLLSRRSALPFVPKI